MEFRKLSKLDLDFLLEIRNHESTRKNLENDSIFTLEQCQNWYKTLSSPWLIILKDGIRVGYIRTSGGCVGIDIHMDHRKKGYAKQAYKEYLKDKNYAKLWVFDDNFAKELYIKLNFIPTGIFKTIKGKKYILMEYKKMKKAVQVLATYFGNRRNYPQNKIQVSEVLNKQIESLYNLDVGIDCDLLIVNHDIEDPLVYDYLSSISGIKIKNGEVRILHRPIVNRDLSFGSYKYAFHKFEDEYDYWFFNEDDIFPLRENYIKEMIDIIENDSLVGFVAALTFNKVHNFSFDENGYIDKVGIYNHPPHAHGGVGLTTTKILKNIRKIIPSYFETPNINPSLQSKKILNGGYGGDHVEINFTNEFCKAGYKLKSYSNGTYFKRSQTGDTL